MRRLFVLLSAAAMVAGGGFLPTAAGAADGGGEVGRWIVTLEAGADPGAFAAAASRGSDVSVHHVFDTTINGFAFTGPRGVADAMTRRAGVARVEADRPVRALAQTTPLGIQRIDADDAHAAGSTGAGAVVAVLDTGVDLNHPDLAANIHPTLGIDCINGDSIAQDDEGHGTHVAGTIAAVDNSTGVVGVGPAISIVPVKVLDSNGSGYDSDIICGIDYVTANAGSIHAANMSLGRSGSDDPTNCGSGAMHQAICSSVAAGVFYAVAAGNDGSNASSQVPAKFSQVTTVSALEDTDGLPGGLGGCVTKGSPFNRYCDDALASFSNYGSVVDLIAPGVNVTSTIWNDGYASASGTSMASPHVAGVAGLVMAADPTLTPAEVEALLEGTGQCPDGSTNDGDATCNGAGSWAKDSDGVVEPLVNAVAALGGDGGDPPPPPPGGVDASLSYSSTNDGRTWSTTVTVTVLDDASQPLAGVSVTGTWGAPISSGDSCVTTGSGTCTVSASGMRKKDGSVSYSVTHVDHPDWNGQMPTITALKP